MRASPLNMENKNASDFDEKIVASISGPDIMTKLWRRIEFDDHKDHSPDSAEVDPTKTDPSAVVDPCCMILSNLTIDPENCEIVWRAFVQVSNVKIFFLF